MSEDSHYGVLSSVNLVITDVFCAYDGLVECRLCVSVLFGLRPLVVLVIDVWFLGFARSVRVIVLFFDVSALSSVSSGPYLLLLSL